MDNNAETLKRLIRLWSVILDAKPKTVAENLKKALNVETFADNEPAQKRAIKYLRDKLEGDK